MGHVVCRVVPLSSENDGRSDHHVQWKVREGCASPGFYQGFQCVFEIYRKGACIERGMATSLVPAVKKCYIRSAVGFLRCLTNVLLSCRFNFLDMLTFAKLEASRSSVHRMRTGIL